MKNIVVFIITFSYSILISAQTFPVMKVKDAGPDQDRLNFIFISDGYTSAQLGSFASDVDGVINDLFTTPPYSNYGNFFNVFRMDVPSSEAGADHPGTATDVTEPASPIKEVDNYFGSRFDAFGIHRLLVSNNSTVFTALANNYPGYDQAFVLVGDATYGGSGGSIAVSSNHAQASEISIHEIGHSFANLGDEYNASCLTGRYNLSTDSDPVTIKWADWIGSNGIGIYGIGNGCNRPHNNCKMRYLGSPFCAVCIEGTIDRIYLFTDPIDTIMPKSTNIAHEIGDIDFAISTINPDPNTLKLEWFLDGVLFDEDTTAITISESSITQENHIVTARVTDTTDLSMLYQPALGYVFEQEWQLTASVLKVEFIGFSGVAEEDYNVLQWTVAQENNTNAYRLYRSTDNINWEEIYFIPVQEPSLQEKTYRYLDHYVPSGISYYKVVEEDHQNNITSSNVISLKATSKWFYKIRNNPGNGIFGLDLYSNEKNIISLNIYDGNGKNIKSLNRTLEIGNHFINLDLSNQSSGSYFLQIQKGNWRKTLPLIKL